jgi:hypothetical protein
MKGMRLFCTISGEQHAVRLDHHHHIARRMRRAGVDHLEAFAAQR